MKMRVKANRCVSLSNGVVVESGQEHDVAESDHASALINIDAGHFDLLSLEEDDEPEAAVEVPDAPKKRRGRPPGSGKKSEAPPAPDMNSEAMTDGNDGNPGQSSDPAPGV